MVSLYFIYDVLSFGGNSVANLVGIYLIDMESMEDPRIR
jgi:hypothetical protein